MRLDHLLSKELEGRAPLALWVGVLAPRGAPECGVRGCFWVEHQDSVAPCRGGVARGEYGLSWVWSPSGGWCLGGRGKLGWCRLVGVQTRCWVLRDRAVVSCRAPCGCVAGGGVSGCSCWGHVLGVIPASTCWVGVCGGGLVGGGWLLVENCTVDASICIFVAFC